MFFQEIIEKNLSLGKNQLFHIFLQNYALKSDFFGCFVLLSILPDGLVLIVTSIKHFVGLNRFTDMPGSKNISPKKGRFFAFLQHKYVNISKNMHFCPEKPI